MNSCKSQRYPIVFCAATMSFILMALLSLSLRSYAENPRKAVISQIRGQKEIWVRRRGRPTPAQVGSILEHHYDSLLVNGNSRTYAFLKFLSKSNRDLRLFVQTEIHPKSAIYYFPCALHNGTHLFGWGLALKRSRGCTRAVRIRGGDPPRAALPQRQLPVKVPLSESVLVAQSLAQQMYYCTVTSSTGQSWLAIKRGKPCAAIIQACLAHDPNGTCTEETLDHWWTTEPNLTAVVECADAQMLTATGAGSDLKTIVMQLWQQAITQGATSCVLQVYAPNDLLVAPASDPVVTATDVNPFLASIEDARILVRTRSTDACPEVKVLNGAVVVKSAQNPQGTLVQLGNKSVTDFCEQPAVEPIDLESESHSLPIEILTANIKGIPFCDEEQASGGSPGDRRIIQLTATQGTLDIEYEMFDIPDQLQIFYEGNELYDSGLTSGRKEFSLPFQGNSGRIEVVLTGNQDPNTKWNYTISCPGPE